ncbi:MAG: methionyl-tRNA formyltransferase, methionyl-tRNA formyltransferase [Parcubacteria group bacterium]|nr:methionyl-tRNA formyltransferase, methionyl-tRNA formyltransferase [Parcubacteria group bacterium]
MKNNFIFFGTSNFSVYVLDALYEKECAPTAVVTFHDKPNGRNLTLVPNPVKVWAKEHHIEVIETDSVRSETHLTTLKHRNADVFVVASFGKIMPKELIYLPPHKTLNVHPSLLPKLRGPAPIQGAILGEEKTGVTIMRMDEKMDEGPILVAEEVSFPTWPVHYEVAEKKLGKAGGELLARILPMWTSGALKEAEQNPSLATYTHMIKKSDADITNDNPESALRKIYAYSTWPRARKGDLIITSAHIENGNLIFDKVIPPGRKEMSYADYLRGKK